jgi:hypothetical protein
MRGRIGKRKKEIWILFFLILTVTFIAIFISNFISNCIFEWPIRWDICTCYNEQIQPSKQKAIEKTIILMP